MENTNTFALIDPAGTLHFETGVPDVMWDQTDPHFHTTAGFQVTHLLGREQPGMRGYVGDVSANHPHEYPPNPVAEHVVATIVGRPLLEVYGNLTLCGHAFNDDGEDELAGLTAEQQATISAAWTKAEAGR